MASPHRTHRILVVATCLVAGLGVPTVASAGIPPEHAPAHGHPSRDDDGGRATSSATATTRDDGDDATTGRGRGREDAPGQRGKASDPARGGTATDGRDRGEPSLTSPEPTSPEPTSPEPTSPTPTSPAPQPDGPTVDPRPTAEPEPPEPADPVAPSEEPAAPVVGPESGPPASGPSAQAPTAEAAGSETAEPGTIRGLTDRPVWRPDLGGSFGDLLDQVDRGVQRLDQLVPRDLGPAGEPLARLVPLLLAVLGAFLALQRGIGAGLGHVPMVAATAPRDPVRRD